MLNVKQGTCEYQLFKTFDVFYFLKHIRIAATLIQSTSLVGAAIEHGFESHSQPFLMTYPGLIKAYDFLSSLFYSA